MGEPQNREKMRSRKRGNATTQERSGAKLKVRAKVNGKVKTRDKVGLVVTKNFDGEAAVSDGVGSLIIRLLLRQHLQLLLRLLRRLLLSLLFRVDARVYHHPLAYHREPRLGVITAGGRSLLLDDFAARRFDHSLETRRSLVKLAISLSLVYRREQLLPLPVSVRKSSFGPRRSIRRLRHVISAPVFVLYRQCVDVMNESKVVTAAATDAILAFRVPHRVAKLIANMLQVAVASKVEHGDEISALTGFGTLWGVAVLVIGVPVSTRTAVFTNSHVLLVEGP